MLWVCATPIGNLGDVTPRLLEALRAADLVAAEDTRHTRKLLSHFDIHTPLTSLFQHNEAQKTEEIMGLLREGKDVALVSDAGMPGVSDPGQRLVARAAAEALSFTVLPGPSAVLTALVAAGYEGDGFRFVGYLPRRPRDLETKLQGWRRCGGLVVAFETAPRLSRSLAVLSALIPDVRVAVCRELTKLHEEIARGTALELSERYSAPKPDGGHGAARGEITMVIDLGEPLDAEGSRPGPAAAAQRLLARGLSRRDAAAALHVCLGMPRREAESLAREVAAEL
jgi:16S rRNA (cytidine1402-2'-O)-methyltransferase